MQPPQMTGVVQAPWQSNQTVVMGSGEKGDNGLAVGALVFSLLNLGLAWMSVFDIMATISILTSTTVIILAVTALMPNRRKHGGTIPAVIALLLGLAEFAYVMMYFMNEA